MAYVKDRLQVSDIKKALGKDLHDDVMKAEFIMNKWRNLVMDAGLDKNEHGLSFVLSMGDIALAAHTLSIRLAGEKQYQSPEGLAHDLCACLQGMGHEIESPWSHAEETIDTASKSTEKAFDPALLLREVTEDGKIKNPAAVLSSAGFEIGCHLKRKADGQEGKLESIDPNGACKIRVPGETRLAKLQVFAILNGEWSKFAPSAEPIALDNLAPHSALKHETWKKHLAQPKAFIALDVLAKKLDPPVYKMLELQLRPNKAVLVKGKIQKRKLVLVPMTTSLKPKKHDHCLYIPFCLSMFEAWFTRTRCMCLKCVYDPHLRKPDSLSLDSISCDGEDFILQSNLVIPQDAKIGCISMYFLVQTTHDAEEANMEVNTVKEGDAKVPLLRNSKVLNIGDKLMRFVPKKTVTPEELQYSPAAKRRRTKGAE